MSASWAVLLALWTWQGQPMVIGVDVLDPSGNAWLTPVEVTVQAVAEAGRPDSLDQQWNERQPFSAIATDVLGSTTSVAGRAHFLLGSEQSWSFHCADTTRWCAPLYLDSGQDIGPLKLTTWPRQMVSGRLTIAKQATPPDLLIQGWATDGNRILDFVTRTEVDSDGRFHFESPDLPLELRLTAGPPWGPIYLWDQTSPGASLDLGALSLVPGASVTAYVIDESTGDAIEGANVRWLSAMEVDSRRGLARRNLLQRQANSDARGFVQLDGLPPGIYHLRAAAKGMGDVELGPFEVDEGVELHLDEVLLQPLATLTLRVTPEADPDDKPWNVSLEEDRPKPRFSGYEATTEQGAVTLRIPKRRYRISLRDPAQKRTVLQRAVDIDSNLDLDLQPRLVTVEGRLTLGGEPLQAGILVDGGHSNQKRFDTDDAGYFQGWMGWKPDGDPPETLTLWIQTEPSALGIRQSNARPHTVEVDLRDDVLYLEVDLPNRSLRGRVVDSKSHPVEGASVGVSVPGNSEGPVDTTDAKGAFELLAIPEGHPVQVSAWAEGRGSGSKELADWGEGEGPDTVLALSDLRTLQGYVLASDGQPVGGAELSISAHHFDDATANVAGAFEVQVNADDTRGQVTVKAAGFPYWSRCMALPEDGPLIVPLPATGSGGRLNLDFSNFEAPKTGGNLIILTPDGGFAGLSALHQWAIGQEGSSRQDFANRKLSFPNLSPGLYSAVWFDGRGPTYDVLCDRSLPLLADPIIVPKNGEATLRLVN